MKIKLKFNIIIPYAYKKQNKCILNTLLRKIS
jgi:hypothetical protein